MAQILVGIKATLYSWKSSILEFTTEPWMLLHNLKLSSSKTQKKLGGSIPVSDRGYM